MKIGRKLIGMLTGGLLGYIWGWIWGWSLFDPNSDVWALAAGFGSLSGLVLGTLSLNRRQVLSILCATIGLYSGWIMRTLLFGDRVDGWGALVMLACATAGGAIGVWLDRRVHGRPVMVLGGALYIGFFGGFAIDVLLLDVFLGVVRGHSILSQAPAVLACGIVGGAILARWQTGGPDHANENIEANNV